MDGKKPSEMKLLDTTIEQKREFWPVFAELVERQFSYGGVKYAQGDEREVTDILTEGFGLGGLLWTMGKYLFRFRNQGREKDLLKLSCYCFITWLKFGFHLKQNHDEDVKIEEIKKEETDGSK